MKLLGRSVQRCGLNISRWDEDVGGSHFGRFARSTSDIAQTGRPAAACGGMSGLPKQLKNRQNCCRNATPAEYMFPKVKNAQKGGTCLSFLLHGRDGAFQIGIS